MPEDLMRYDQLAQHALRGVVREALRLVERGGLPGEHHFYIAFNTKHPGVNIGDRLSARYPREMTIVLQHQFWNLSVMDDRFEVELSFDNIPEKLVIPFEAVKGFLDPAVQFGLQFEVVTPPAVVAPEAADVAKPPAEKKSAEMEPAMTVNEEMAVDGKAPDELKVVSLDSFRKK